jgi:hypothetical protein
LEKLYIGFIRPILEYGGIVWDNCILHESELLESVQLEAARIITGLRKGTSHAKLYTESTVPNYSPIFKYWTIKSNI